MRKKKNFCQLDYCAASNNTRKVYRTEEQLKLRLEKDKKRPQLYPLNAFFCTSCNGWHVTRHPVIDGKELIDEKVLAWEQKRNQANDLSTLISNILKEITSFVKMGQITMVHQLLQSARAKIGKLRKLKNEEAIREFTQKLAAIESLINSLRNRDMGEDYSRPRIRAEQEKKRNIIELSPKLIQKIDNMIEEAESLTEVNINQTYDLIRECQSQIEHIKYGENLSDLKNQWIERLDMIKDNLKKRA